VGKKVKVRYTEGQPSSEFEYALDVEVTAISPLYPPTIKPKRTAAKLRPQFLNPFRSRLSPFHR
jgi:hypothetical protein